MAPPRRFADALRSLWGLMSRRRRIQFFGIIAVMVLASGAEIFSLGMVVPFLAVLVDPENITSMPLLADLSESIDPRTLVLWLGAAFCAATLVSAVVRLLVLYVTTKFTFVLGADFSKEVYRRALYQPYVVHLSRNTSEVINGVIAKANAVSGNVLGQILTIASASLLSVGVLGALLFVNAGVTLVAVAGFVLVYGLILFGSRRLIARQSAVIAEEGPRSHKALQEGLGGIRDVIIDGTQETFVDAYRVADRRMRTAQARLLFAGGSPRFLIESLGMILIVIIAIVASSSGASASVVAILGALALGAQRLLPVVQQGYAALVTIRGSEVLMWDVLDILKQPLPTTASHAARLDFTSTLQLDGVGFRYEGGHDHVIADVRVTINKGSRVGILGPTGSGKSTLLDVLMGLLQPTAGQILVDGKPLDEMNRHAWQSHIAHVPQTIFLSDATIAENIAFGRRRSEIDMNRVRLVAGLAQIADAIELLPQGYNTEVGERGARLSGGQRQRIGVARALYKGADVIIFDEATSALDNKTESQLISALDSLDRNLTMIMVAHRLSTLEGCDMLLEVKDGRVAVAPREEVFGVGT